jgi:cellulose biosynthesis protein BcsQ
MVAAKQLQFKEVIMDDPENRNLVEGLDLVTSTVVLIRFEGMEEDTTLVLARSWELYDKETEFKQMLLNQLDHILEGRK